MHHQSCITVVERKEKTGNGFIYSTIQEITNTIWESQEVSFLKSNGNPELSACEFYGHCVK